MNMTTQQLDSDTLWADWTETLPEELREQDGIKAQFAAAIAVITFLSKERKGAGWTFLPTVVGQWEDRIGVDGYLVCLDNDAHYAVDFSLEGALNPKGNKRNTPWLVHLNRDWFRVQSDGMWVLRPECMQCLARAFIPTLRNGPVTWKPASTAVRGS